MCQGHKNCYVYCTENTENQCMDLRLSLAEVSKVTGDLKTKCGKEDETLQLTSAGRLCQVKAVFGIEITQSTLFIFPLCTHLHTYICINTDMKSSA